jgi:ubiquinone/menaquinone biosynthesis C-methylase UbiE
MSEDHPQFSEDQIYFFEKQEVVVHHFDASRFILDIGGGGEGIIGQMKGQQVVAIDPNRRELEEAAEGPLKVVMDAGDMLFLDASFEVVTSFFTLMYINGAKHEKVFQEAFRVLESGGRFLIWDVELPPCLDEGKDIVAFFLNIKLPDREVETGYGADWPEQTQGLSYYMELAEKVGFTVSDQKENGRLFYLKLRKP